eukprot:Transcript_9641.p1 GENE.Transcript_9641~~Transcript_9641.p1  ORF type:complete len:556 (-),score=136.43 Transcript_9641:107-1774(-)
MMAPHAHQTPPIGRRTREDGRPRSRPTSRPSSSRRDSHGSSIPRPQQAHYYPSPMRRAASSPARPRHKSPSTFGFGKATRRDPSPADSERSERSERGARPSASARGDTSSGSGKVRRAGATAVGDAGFRQSNVKVALRCRPLSGKERRAGEVAVVGVHEQTVTILTGGEADDTHVFAFDYAFGPEADQVSLFAACGAPLVEQLFEGFNATCFAYGQTGSGKTYTMMGSDDEPGLTPRVCWFLFDRMESLAAQAARRGATRKFRVAATYLQIYNEALHDMLAEEGAAHPPDLKIRACPQRGVFVQGLSEHAVTSPQQVKELIARGNHARATSATKMNASSSRSHAVFTLHLQQEMVVPRHQQEISAEPPSSRAAPQGGGAAAAGPGGPGAPGGAGLGGLGPGGPGGGPNGHGGGVRSPLEAWPETAREEAGSDDDGGGGGGGGDGGGGGAGGGGGGLTVNVRGSHGSVFSQAYDDGLKALLTPQARKLRSKLNLVDLAGSERAKASGADEEEQLVERAVCPVRRHRPIHRPGASWGFGRPRAEVATPPVATNRTRR